VALSQQELTTIVVGLLVRLIGLAMDQIIMPAQHFSHGSHCDWFTLSPVAWGEASAILY